MRRVVSTSITDSRTESRPASRFAGKRVHFIGIGGSGMSGLARMLLDSGAVVTGSEPRGNEQTDDLAGRGVHISDQQLGRFLTRDVDLVVRTAAVPDSNVEFQIATRMGLRTVKYAQLLGEVMSERLGVAVAGTHGKSTTTAMIAHALLSCGKDPSFVIGGTVPQLGGGARSGGSEIFVAEACEYDRSFHNLAPTVAVITNIDADHLDCYADINDIIESFRDFASLVPADGPGQIIAAAEDRVAQALMPFDPAIIQWCALETPAEWTVHSAGIVGGCHTGRIVHHGQPVADLKLRIPGRHNLSNALLAVAACHACGLAPQPAADAIGTFLGVDRRMTELGQTSSSAIVVDDYAHHPTEITATLEALRERYGPSRLIAVFQPHQASRTRLLMDGFADAFASADLVVLPEIYFVRDSEDDRRLVSSAQLARRISERGIDAKFLPTFDQVIDFLCEQSRAGDLIVTMGAGNVWEIGKAIVCDREIRAAG
jgi:UDP-N-acetylmuramate--alanine ligase